MFDLSVEPSDSSGNEIIEFIVKSTAIWMELQWNNIYCQSHRGSNERELIIMDHMHYWSYYEHIYDLFSGTTLEVD